jgi:acetylornithine/succinyldiaminopimelate/putrescine aminotransferase
MKKGLLLVNAGPNVLRFVPPLTVNEIEINGAAAILKQLCRNGNKERGETAWRSKIL